MARDRCREVEDFGIKKCYAVHFSNGFPAAQCTATSTLKEVAFEDSDGELSVDGQVVDNEIERLIKGYGRLNRTSFCFLLRGKFLITHRTLCRLSL